MKTYKTDSDIGSVLVGTKEFGVALTNGCGDGETTVIVLDKGEEDKLRKDATFNTSIGGTFNIYSYDCSMRTDEDILTTLSGQYGVYYWGYEVYFVEW